MGLILKHHNTRPAPETVLYDYQIFFLYFAKLLLKTQESNLVKDKDLTPKFSQNFRFSYIQLIQKQILIKFLLFNVVIQLDITHIFVKLVQDERDQVKNEENRDGCFVHRWGHCGFDGCHQGSGMWQQGIGR
jgi:hypothetical protein